MLQNIRDNSQGWIAKTIIGIIVILLALTGVEAIFSTSGRSTEVVQVNGEAISQNELNQAVSMQRDQLLQQLGAQFDASLLNEQMLRASALENLINRRLLLQAAHDNGFAFSQTALDQVLLQTPDFQVNGTFNADRFDQILRQMGYSRLQFRELLQQEMLIGQLQSGIAGSAFVTDQQIDAFARLERQSRDFRVAVVSAEPSAIDVSDEELEAFYAANEQRFRSPEQVVIEYLTLEKESFFDSIEVADEDVQALYEKQVSALSEQRRAAHILIEVNEQTADADARAQIEAIRTQLDSGESFEKLAREKSQDPGSAKDGGDLGFAGTGVYDLAFERALFALSEGELSPPVRSEFGWHLIKLLDVQPAEAPSLEAMRPELERQIKQEQVEQQFVQARRQLETVAYESSDLQQPAQELGLEVKTSAPFGREGGAGIAANKQVIQAAFSEPVLIEAANSTPIELDPETVAVVRVKEHLKPQPRPLEQVRDEIVQQLKQEKAAELAKEEGEAVLAALRGGEAGSSAATLQWRTIEAADRGFDDVAPQVLQRVFRMPRPEGERASFAGLSLPSGDYALIQLDGVNEPDEPLSDELKQDYRRFLASRVGQQDFSALMSELRATADIKRK